MNARDLRAFAERPWDLLESSKREHWAREIESRGADATFEAAQALWLYMRALRPEWPSPDDRADDLAHHVELKRTIDRVARVLAAITPR